MEKFKIEFSETQKYVIDVLAKDEAEAIEKARARLYALKDAGIIHHHEEGDPEIAFSASYNVTNTDDPFNP